MIRKVSVFVVLVLWIALPGAIAIRSIESVPASDGGVLTAGVEQQISLTCSHDNTVTAATFWKISAPIDCSRSFTHQSGSTSDCGPFSFINVTQGTSPPYISTAVASANTSMTGAVVQCLDGAGSSPDQVGSNITLCVYGPVSEVSCSIISNLEISWNAVIDSPACVNKVEYMVTITNISGVVTTRNVSVNQIDVSDVFQRGESYNVSVCSKAVNGSCSAEPVTLLCEISLTPPSPTTLTTFTTSPQGTPVAAIVVPVILVLVLVAAIVIVIVIFLIVYVFCRPGRNKRYQKQKASEHAGEGENKAKTAPVPAKVDKPNSARADNTKMATYQVPATIQHKQAPSGDLYALSDKLERGEKSKESQKSEVPATIQHEPAANGALYALTDKSRKEEISKESKKKEDPTTIQHESAANGALYALTDKSRKEEISKESQKKELNSGEIETGGESGTPVDQEPQTNYNIPLYIFK